MDILDTIMTRRSVRNYKKDKVPNELLDKIVEYSLHAPSSKNSQPWHITVIQRESIIKKIGNILISSQNIEAEPSDPRTGKIREGFNSTIKASGDIILGAPALLVIENTCSFSGGRQEVMKSNFRNNAINGHDSEVISIGAMIENISLVAHSLGLGSVIIADAVAEEEKIKQLLNIKGDLIAVIPIGYPSLQYPPRNIKEGLVTYIR
jgi:nitroreductase